MFKGFQSKSRQFNGFPSISFGMNREAHGFGNCIFQLEASYGVMLGTGSAVAAWYPRIGAGFFVQATAANQPTYTSSDAFFNNYPSVRSTDGGRFMSGVSTRFGNATYAVVYSIDVNQPINAIIGQGRGASSNPRYFIGQSGTNGVGTGFGYYGNTSFQLVGTTSIIDRRICIVSNDTVMADGVVEASGTPIAQSFWSNLNTIFQADNSNNARLTGRIAEIVGFSGNMSQDDMLLLHNRLNDRYVIY